MGSAGGCFVSAVGGRPVRLVVVACRPVRLDVVASRLVRLVVKACRIDRLVDGACRPVRLVVNASRNVRLDVVASRNVRLDERACRTVRLVERIRMRPVSGLFVSNLLGGSREMLRCIPYFFPIGCLRAGVGWALGGRETAFPPPPLFH